MSKKILVIGASAASVSFLSKLRSFDTSSEIICYSGESSFPYNRCLLADFISLEINAGDMALKSDNFFQENNIDLRLDSWVTAIDREQKTITVHGEQESYDYLFLGTGTSAWIPSIPIR